MINRRTLFSIVSAIASLLCCMFRGKDLNASEPFWTIKSTKVKSSKAMWDDFKLCVGKHRSDFEKLRVVGGPKWIQPAMDIGSHFEKAECKVFAVDQLAEAWDWVKS